jgi:hypothetical protein
VVSVIPVVTPETVTATPPEVCIGECSVLAATAPAFTQSWMGVQAFNSANLDQNEGWSATANGLPHNIQASADNEENTHGILPIRLTHLIYYSIIRITINLE